MAPELEDRKSGDTLERESRPEHLRIASGNMPAVSDRTEAGRLLARELVSHSGPATVVLGIPLGGVVVARGVSRYLESDLDIVFVERLPAPAHQDVTLGAVSGDGRLFLNETIVQRLGATEEFVQAERVRQLAAMARLNRLVRQRLEPVPLRERTVLVVDDGVITGTTMRAAIWTVRQEHPERLIVAVPSGTEEALSRLAEEADEVVSLGVINPDHGEITPSPHFEKVSESDVLKIIREEQERKDWQLD